MSVLYVCAGGTESFENAFTCGIGLINASINLSKFLATQKHLPQKLVFIGTCGLYDKSKELFSIIKSQNATNIEISALLNLSYSPIISAQNQQNSAINSSNFISKDLNIAKKFNQINLVAENMEFYAVCEVAKAFNLECEGVFCASNYCENNAHEQFLANHAKAIEILKNYLEQKNEKYFRF